MTEIDAELGKRQNLIVDEVRRVREDEAAKYGFDVKAILVASKRRQRRSRRKVVPFTPEKEIERLV
jgi:hypothetical protein